MNNKSHELLEDLIYIGEIIKPHGVKGYLKFFLYNENSNILLDNQVIYLEDKVNKLKLEIEDINFVSSIPLIKFIDIEGDFLNYDSTIVYIEVDKNAIIKT